MSTQQTIDRQTAYRINPFISDCQTDETLGRCASAMRTLGLMIEADPGGIRLDSIYMMLHTVASALDYERDSLESKPAAA